MAELETPDTVEKTTVLPQRMYIKEDYDDRGVEVYYVSDTKDGAEYVEYARYSPARDAAGNAAARALEGLMWRFANDDSDPNAVEETAPDVLAARAALKLVEEAGR
jgi:hypothetical protein